MGNLHCDCFISDSFTAYNKAKALLAEIKFPLVYKRKYSREHFNIRGSNRNKCHRAIKLLLRSLQYADANYLLGVIYSYGVCVTVEPFNPFNYASKPNISLKYIRVAANKGHADAITLLPELEKEEEERLDADWKYKREQRRHLDIARKPYWDHVDKERRERDALVAKHPEIPILEQIRDKQDDIKRAINNIPSYYVRY